MADAADADCHQRSWSERMIVTPPPAPPHKGEGRGARLMTDSSEFDDTASAAEPLRTTLRDLESLADGFGRAMTTAFKRSVVDGKRLEDVLKSLALSLSGRALDRALAPIGQ